MKKILFLIIAATLLAFSANAQTQLCGFKFDNSYTAAVGVGTFASNSGTSFTADRNGVANSALNINNGGSIAVLQNLPSGNAARTVELWVKMNVVQSTFNYLYTYGPTSAPEGVLLDPTNIFNFYPNYSAAATTVVGTWYQLVFTFDGTTSRTYRNGTLIGSYPGSKTTTNTTGFFRLGLPDTGQTGYFNGAVDDLKIYNYALSDAQVAAAYTPPPPPPASGLIYSFKFDNSYSATVGTGTFTNTGGTFFIPDRSGNATGAIRLTSGTDANLPGLPYGSAARTVAFWVKINIMKPNYNYMYVYGTADDPDGAFLNPGSARNFIPNNVAQISSVAGTWYHYAFTYDGTTSRVYRNGTLLSTSAGAKNTVNNNNIFRLGLTESGDANYFDGAIDDLNIYNSALSAAQVNALYNAIVSTNDVATASNPIGVYPNPTANQISFSELTNVQLHNVVGQVITNQKNVNSLDLTAQPAGMYLATFTDDKGKVLQVSKIVKQ